MDIVERAAITEKRLQGRAASLGELLDQLQDRISPVLIGGRPWDLLVERARTLPVALAAFPFGFELPLHDIQPRADLGVSLMGGTGACEFFEQGMPSDPSEPGQAGIRHTLEQTGDETSPLAQVVGQKMMLEYDIDASGQAVQDAPGIFLRPALRAVGGGGGTDGLRDLDVVLDALEQVAGWDLAGERQIAHRLYSGLREDARIESFGVFPGREKAVRLTVQGFRERQDVDEILAHVQWSGPSSLVSSTVSYFAARKAFARLGLHFDILEDGIGPALGMSFVVRELDPEQGSYWLDSPHHWSALIQGLHEAGLGRAEKLNALAAWPGPAQLLDDETGALVLLRGIHHIKLVFREDHIDQVKGYVYLILAAWDPQAPD